MRKKIAAAKATMTSTPALIAYTATGTALVTGALAYTLAKKFNIDLLSAGTMLHVSDELLQSLKENGNSEIVFNHGTHTFLMYALNNE
jgi:hypothetical protein